MCLSYSNQKGRVLSWLRLLTVWYTVWESKVFRLFLYRSVQALCIRETSPLLRRKRSAALTVRTHIQMHTHTEERRDGCRQRSGWSARSSFFHYCWLFMVYGCCWAAYHTAKMPSLNEKQMFSVLTSRSDWPCMMMPIRRMCEAKAQSV